VKTRYRAGDRIKYEVDFGDDHPFPLGTVVTGTIQEIDESSPNPVIVVWDYSRGKESLPIEFLDDVVWIGRKN
jgi:hypothetical protein